MDEGLGSQVDEFAKELDGCKSDEADIEECEIETSNGDEDEFRATTLLNQSEHSVDIH